jgi:hypothetical protein
VRNFPHPSAIISENLQIVDIWDIKNIAALSAKIDNFDKIPVLANFDKNYFCPLGFLKSTSDSLEIDIKTDFKIDFKIFQLVHLRFEKQKSPKSANEPTLSFSYKILDSVWCK